MNIVHCSTGHLLQIQQNGFMVPVVSVWSRPDVKDLDVEQGNCDLCHERASCFPRIMFPQNAMYHAHNTYLHYIEKELEV
jgi:hypothetical protein